MFNIGNIATSLPLSVQLATCNLPVVSSHLGAMRIDAKFHLFGERGLVEALWISLGK
jgi:hypothetical protein